MARTLYLFKKVKPNLGNNTHYFIRGNALRMTLQNNPDYYVGSFAENSYRIETGHVKLQAQTGNYNAITYIIDEDTETGYFKAYHVSNNTLISGFVDFSVSVDLWASNIFLADFSRIHVTRCNRNLGNGWYDNVQQSHLDPSYYEPAVFNSVNLTRNEALQRFSIFFIADCVIAQTIAGEDPVTSRKIIAMPLTSFFDMAADATNHEGKGYKPIEIATEIISGIYKFDETGWQDFKVNVKSIFVVPYVPAQRLRPKFKSFSMFGEKTLQGYVCDAAIVRNQYNIAVENIQYDYYLGAGFNVKPLRRYINSVDSVVQFIFIISADGLKVTMRQGNHDDDITDAFMLPVTGNAQNSSTLEKIAKAINYGLNAFGNFAGALNVTKPEQALGAGVNAVTGSISQVTEYFGNGGASPASIAPNGDATTTFGWQVPNSSSIDTPVTTITNPFTIFKFTSIRDEAAHARLNGANFDKYISSFNYASAMPLLGTGSLTDTYIVVDDIEIEGVQEDAETFIKSELARGIYYRI